MSETEFDLITHAMPDLSTGVVFRHPRYRANDDVIVDQCEPLDDPRRDQIVVLIPAYNEDRLIGSVALKARKFASTVIVVDDGSTDSTSYVAAGSGAMVVRHLHNKGKAGALKTGFEYTHKYHPRAVVVLDGDGQHLTEELYCVVDPILSSKADIVVGSRYIRPASRVPRHRVWGHWAFNLLTRIASGVAVSDSQSGYRAFSPKAMDAIRGLLLDLLRKDK